MKNIFNVYKNKKIEYLIILIIIIIGFLLRLYASFSVPLVADEIEKINFSKEINLYGKDFNLPLGSEITHNPPPLPYLMKISFLLFGENKIAARLPSIILGTLTLLISYFLVRNYLNKGTAMLSLVLMSFSQFYIGSTRIAWEDGILLFFATLLLLFVQKAIHSKKRSYLMLAGLTMGLGLLVKGTIITILPVIIFYIFLYPKNKSIFSTRDFFIFLLIISVVISPSIYWNIKNNYSDYQFYLQKADFLSFSLVPTALFLGEIIVLGMYNFDDAIFFEICSYEYPFLNWFMGLICIFGAVYFLRSKRNNFIVLLLWIFYFNFIFFSFVRPETGGGLYFHLDNFWWATVTVIPGFILGSAMLVKLGSRYKLMRLILPLLVLYFIINSIIFINFPANCFIPRNSIKVKELFDTAEIYLKEGKKGKAFKVYDYIKKHYPKSIKTLKTNE